MMAEANKFMELYMVEATNRIGIESSDPWDVLKRLWDEMQADLAARLSALLPPKKKRKRKRSVGKKRAKRGRSAYMCFCAEERAKLKTSHPEMKGKEVMVELGKRWRVAKKGDISKWEEQAAKDKARVEESAEQAQPKKKKAKKGRSAYNFFCKELRPTVKAQGLAPREIMTELGKRWREAKKGDISKWVKMAAKDKARYKKESEAEEDIPPPVEKESEAEEDVPPVEKESEAEEDVPPVEKKSVKKRIYAYSFWAKMHRSEITRSTGLKGKELTKELSTQWKALSKAEKAEWKAATLEAAEAAAE